jgi:ribonuclease R
MAKAVYSTNNIGHYGLAFAYYTHFTSPIRRYPDMMVHRLLKQYMKGSASGGREEYEERCKHCSEQEQLAAAAERASVKYKQVEFMQQFVGMSFEGIISGVTDYGIYVEIKENGCEGLVPMRDISDKYTDYFFCREDAFLIEGLQTKTQLRLGDKIEVKVVEANLEKRQLDFALV